MLPDNLSPFWAVRNISQATNTFLKKDLEKDYYKVLGLLGKNFTPENLICFLVAKTTLEVQISVCPSQNPSASQNHAYLPLCLSIDLSDT